MPKRRRTREIARQRLGETARVTGHDYFERSSKRSKPDFNSNGQNSAFEVLGQHLDERTARRVRREADKLSQTRQADAQTVSHRRGNVQLTGLEETGDGNGGSADEEEDDNGDADEVDHARITQAMNQARNPTVKPTINGIGSLRRNKEPRHTEGSSDIEEDDQEERDNGRSTTEHGETDGAPQAQNQRSRKGRDRPSQQADMRTSTPEEEESEVESSTEIDDQVAEDTAFVEAPQQGEETETVRVIIKSMGGIFRTLKHPAWTNLTHWDRDFASEENDDGQKTCKTRPGKDLMQEIQGLNNILEEATGVPEELSEDDYDITSAAIEYLRTRSAGIQQHLIRMDKIVDGICRQRLRPVPQTGDSRTTTQAVEKRKAMLRDLSQRLIPMLMITVNKACAICPSEDRRSRTSLHVDCFRLQFFLRPLAWADRLHKARERCLDEDSQTGADDPDEAGSKGQGWKEARKTFGTQLYALHYACRKAEREIRDKAAQAKRREREAEINRQNRERQHEQQREREAEEKRKQEEERMRCERQLQAFIKSTHDLRSRPDPLREMWVQSQERLHERSHAISTARAAQGGSLGFHGQSSAGAARHHRGPSRTAQAQPVYQSSDPFLDNYRARSDQTSDTNEAWSEEEEKALTKAIRYKQNYEVKSMAQKIERTEYEVAMKAAFLKQAYRDYYMEHGRPIPAWTL